MGGGGGAFNIFKTSANVEGGFNILKNSRPNLGGGGGISNSLVTLNIIIINIPVYDLRASADKGIDSKNAGRLYTCVTIIF